MKPKVGQILYSLNCNRRECKELTPVQVKSIGRKYFTCGPVGHDFSHTKYHLDTWTEETGGYAPNSILYETPQEWEDVKEATELKKVLRDTFTWNQFLSLDKLRRIKAIIDEP